LRKTAKTTACTAQQEALHGISKSGESTHHMSAIVRLTLVACSKNNESNVWCTPIEFPQVGAIQVQSSPTTDFFSRLTAMHVCARYLLQDSLHGRSPDRGMGSNDEECVVVVEESSLSDDPTVSVRLFWERKALSITR